MINSATGTTATLTEGYYTTAPTTFAGVLANGGGTVALTVVGTNSLTLTGPNTYSGPTTISAGTLQLGDGTPGDDGSINSTSGVADNAALVFNLAGSQTASYAINGSGSLSATGMGTLTLSGTNGYQGGTFVENGILIAANNEAIADGTSLTVGDPTLFPAPVVPMPAASAAAISPVPEPGTLALLAGGAILIAISFRRRRKKVPVAI